MVVCPLPASDARLVSQGFACQCVLWTFEASTCLLPCKVFHVDDIPNLAFVAYCTVLSGGIVVIA